MKKRKKVLEILIKYFYIKKISFLELRSQLMKKEQFLAQTKRELDAIGEYKVCLLENFIFRKKKKIFWFKNIQEQQNNEIKRLQEEINQIRGKHVSEISNMRLTFEKELHQQRMDEGAKVQAIRRQADDVCF